MAKHSKIGASGAYRWLECPGSVPLSEEFPEQASSVYAAEGTAAHDLAERCLLKNKDAKDYIGLVINEFEVDEGMAEAVQEYLDTVREDIERFKGPNLVQGVEDKINLHWIHPDAFGTSDAHVGLKGGTLVVHDYKHGAGVPVDAIGNKQGLYYTLGVASKYGFEFDNYEFVIVQPRAFHPDGGVRRWVFDQSVLDAFESEVKSGIDRIAKARKAPDLMAYLKPGDHCRWCNASPGCPALKRQMEMTVYDDFDAIEEGDILNITPTPPHELTPQRLSEALKFASIMENWVSELRSYAYRAAERGEVPIGFKFVKKYGRRKFKDPNKVQAFLELNGVDKADFLTEPAPPKKKSPAQTEAVLKKHKIGKQVLAPFITTPETGFTIVEDDDRRIAHNAVEDDFSMITD